MWICFNWLQECKHRLHECSLEFVPGLKYIKGSDCALFHWKNTVNIVLCLSVCHRMSHTRQIGVSRPLLFYFTHASSSNSTFSAWPLRIVKMCMYVTSQSKPIQSCRGCPYKMSKINSFLTHFLSVTVDENITENGFSDAYVLVLYVSMISNLASQNWINCTCQQ